MSELERLWREMGFGGTCPQADPKRVRAIVNGTLNAIPSERRRYMRQKLRFAAVLTAAVIALAGTALAVSPSLRGLLENALGSFAPYAQEVNGVSVIDQGIEVRVVSAVADGETAVAYVTVTDLTGNRLDENLGYNGSLGPRVQS